MENDSIPQQNWKLAALLCYTWQILSYMWPYIVTNRDEEMMIMGAIETS